MFNKLLFIYWKTMDLSYFFVDVLMVFYLFFFGKAWNLQIVTFLLSFHPYSYMFSCIIAQAKTLRTTLGSRRQQV